MTKSIKNPPKEPNEEWQDYRVPVEAYGGVVVRARSTEEAMAYVRENVYASDVDLELHVDRGSTDQVRKSVGRDHYHNPHNVSEAEDGDSYVSVPTVPPMNEIRKTREKLGLSQRWVAERMDVSLSTVSKWETGDTNISLERAREYTSILRDYSLSTV